MKLCWPCWRARQDRKVDEFEAGYRLGLKAAGSGGRGPLDVDLAREAIQLCHPDRHPPERFALANRVTAALLELLDEGRKAA